MSGITVYKRGDIWHYRGTIAGKRLRGSTETSDEARARRIASEKETAAWQGKLDGPEATFTFAHACTLYLNAGRSVRMVKHMAGYWKDTLVRDIKTPAIHAAALKLFPNTSGASRNRYVITPTQCIINYAAKQGYCAPLRVERYKVVKNEKTPVTLEWIDKFMKHADPCTGALALFMFLTAARISEALFFQWEHLTATTVQGVTSYSGLVRMTKGGAPTWRRVHIPVVLAEALFRIKRDGAFVFGYDYTQQAAHHWRRICKEAGLPYLSFHACRHGFATSMLHAGIDVVTIARLGGWSSPQHIYSTYGHAMRDLTVTERLLDTKLTQHALLELELMPETNELVLEP